MIISHELRTVFVKTRKTAGSSIELALSTLCGPQDVIAQVPDEDAIRVSYGGRGKQNDDVTWRTLTPKWAATWLWYRRRPRIVREHSPAQRARRFFGDELWSNYFTWAVERNPWDKAVSYYFWDVRGIPSPPTFSEYLRAAPRWKLSCFDLYSHRGEVIVDHVLRYENLGAELGRVWDRLGVPPPQLPDIKSATRPEWSRDYRRVFDDDDAALIGSVCRREIDAFGYEF